MTTVTDNERKVLRALLTNYYTAYNGGIPANYVAGQRAVWTNLINYADEPSGITGASLSGVCASLAKKGLITSEGGGKDACTAITEAGFKIATAT